MFDTPSKPKTTFNKPKTIFRVACILAALGVGGAIWYALPILKRHDSMLAQSAGVKKSVDALGGRLEQQDTKLAQWSNGQEQLNRQIADLRREMRARIETARKQAGQSAEELFRRVQTEVSGQIDSIKAKVARLELSREADQTQIADLENKVSEMRKEMAAQTQQLSDRIAESGSGTERQLAGLRASEERDREEVETIKGKLAVRRIDFEVSKGHNYELAPGISLDISGTDVAYRRVTGWMWVLPDRRTIWLREQGAQEPVVFYSNHDGRKRELVITSVTQKSAVGYLLVPEDGGKAEAALTTASGPDESVSE